MLNDYGYYMKRNVMHGKASNIFLIKTIENLLIFGHLFFKFKSVGPSPPILLHTGCTTVELVYRYAYIVCADTRIKYYNTTLVIDICNKQLCTVVCLLGLC